LAAVVEAARRATAAAVAEEATERAVGMARAMVAAT